MPASRLLDRGTEGEVFQRLTRSLLRIKRARRAVLVRGYIYLFTKDGTGHGILPINQLVSNHGALSCSKLAAAACCHLRSYKISFIVLKGNFIMLYL